MKQSKNINIVKYYKITVFYFNIIINAIYSCDGKAEF